MYGKIKHLCCTNFKKEKSKSNPSTEAAYHTKVSVVYIEVSIVESLYNGHFVT